VINIAGFDTDFKKMPCHGFFYDSHIPVGDSGQPDEKTVFGFPDDVQVFGFAFPAFDAVPFHTSIIGTKVSPTLAGFCSFRPAGCKTAFFKVAPSKLQF
jgi:hypothetical protein